jgi:alpha-tubulin suppressor-like RCC1 family protein
VKKLAALLVFAAACGPGLIEFPSISGPGGGGPPASPAVCTAAQGLVYCGKATCDTLGVLHCGLNNGVCEACPAGYSCSSGVCAQPSTCGKGLILGAGSCVTATQVAAGGNTSCAIAAQGDSTGVYCWGANESGQLGPAASGASSGIANEIATLRGASAIAVGAAHACAIVGGNVLCWGRNDQGQLGSGATASGNVPTPVVVPEAAGAVAIAAGGRHSCAITAAGAVCWGADDFGQHGGNSPVAAAKFATKIVAGDNHTCAQLADRILCWGANDFGQIGNGQIQPSGGVAPFTVSFADATGIANLVAGSNHTCTFVSGNGIDGTNQLRCWGSNGSSQILPDGIAKHPTPVAFKPFAASGNKNLSDAIAAGRAHTCVVRLPADGICFGDNSLGQLALPTTVTVGSSLKAGGDHACFIDGSNLVRCFGSNGSSELGPFGP